MGGSAGSVEAVQVLCRSLAAELAASVCIVIHAGARGLSDEGARQEGKVRLVYPEIEGGRGIADVEAQNVGDYFVGERTKVYVATGERSAIFVPRSYVCRRAGVDYVRLKDGEEVVVQRGSVSGDSVEILSGLRTATN